MEGSGRHECMPQVIRGGLVKSGGKESGRSRAGYETVRQSETERSVANRDDHGSSADVVFFLVVFAHSQLTFTV